MKHSDTAIDLPDPELYVIVNGKPTKAGVVWRSLVNIDDVKSRLLNKYDRFRKYVLYLLWQKEMCEVSAGVYNLLEQARSSDEQLEANLSTMLQSV